MDEYLPTPVNWSHSGGQRGQPPACRSEQETGDERGTEEHSEQGVYDGSKEQKKTTSVYTFHFPEASRRHMNIRQARMAVHDVERET